MSRSIILSNGQLCVALDNHAAVRDIYYPHVGLEDHVRGHYIHRVGVWADGRVSWISDGGWVVSITTEEDALVSVITAEHAELGVVLRFSDTVVHDRNIFLRRVSVRNTKNYARDIALFFAHQFEIQKMHGSDTAYFDPSAHAIVHYKGRRVFLMSADLDGQNFNDYTTGRANFHGLEGSHRDADDGELSKNPIEHGPADSVIGLRAPYAPNQERQCEYWLIAALSISEAEESHGYATSKTPARLLAGTASLWKRWVLSCDRDFGDLTPAHIALYRRSLMYARAHVDHGGGVIASVDSDMLQYGLDTYSYVWPRDSAYVVLALCAAGDHSVAEPFFEFCKDVITTHGYLMHKYLPDQSLGSSWHPWFKYGHPQIPIQEDETAIVIYALAEYVRGSGDLEIAKRLYAPLVEKAADFLVAYRDNHTNLPHPSYDVWERKRGVSTYTSATVFAGLKAAAEIARIVGKDSAATRYDGAAGEVHRAILTHLWRDESGLFVNMVHPDAGSEERDMTMDISSVYGVFLFNVLPPTEMRLRRAFETTVRRLGEGIAIGGIARFENDDYYRVPGASTGNPWFLTTLWHAEYLIATAGSASDLKRAHDLFTWVARYALPSGVLSEQLDPQTGSQICAGPLAWAHAAYVHAIVRYLQRLKELSA